MLEALYYILWIFFIYSFLGWCMEVVYATTDTGRFINRGFLNSPICPIYGTGMVIIVTSLYSVKDNVLLLFLGSMILASLLEFITGFVLEKIFNEKWWDYSNLPFNIKGYICLKFSLAWGFICVFIIKIIYPFTEKFINIIPTKLGIFILVILILSIITDFIITLINILNLPKQIKTLNEIEIKMNKLSESIGKELSDNTLHIQEKKHEFELHIKEENEKIEELKNKYKKLLVHTKFKYKRLLDAFPNIKNGKYKDLAHKILDIRNKKD